MGPDDAPTRTLVGSHLDVPKVLEPIGERGTHFENVVAALPAVDKRKVARATGNAGDVYLCHPFLAHARELAARRHQTAFLAPPALPPAALLQLERPDADHSPVEIAIRVGLARAPTVEERIRATAGP